MYELIFKVGDKMKKIKVIFILLICFNIFLLHQIFLSKNSKSNNLVSGDILTEQVLEDKNFKVEDYFNILTLQQKYGDQLQSKVYLDPNVISFDDLRYLEVLHVGFDGEIHVGELIVNKSVAEEVLQIFREIYDVGFPIEKMKVISHYNNSDDESMTDNNTSAFNFRTIVNGTTLSNHSYGLAIDINPKLNPYITANAVLPENGAEFVDRSQYAKGMIKKDEAVYEIFTKYGWTWGGDWDNLKDYQHFEKNK